MLYTEKHIKNVCNNLANVIKICGDSNIFRKDDIVYVDKCPFCGARETMLINENNEYFCYACGEGGNAIAFVMKMYNFSFSEAIQYLTKALNMVPESITEQKKTVVDTKVMATMEINAIAARFYFTQLRSPMGKKGMHYLNSRKVPETIKISFGLGYAGKFGDSLYQLLKQKGYSDETILNSGLVTKSTKEGSRYSFYDKFWDRVIFPIFDANGQVIAFGGRVLDDTKPKYLNSPETNAYTKGDHLFCYDKAKKSEHDFYICCEGYMDAMTMHQAGFDNAVASLGTALTKNQIKLLKNKKEVILAYDSDAAGINATKRAILLCREAGLPVRVLQVVGAKDPDEFIKKYGSDQFTKLLKQAESDKHFMIRNTRTESGNIDFANAVKELL